MAGRLNSEETIILVAGCVAFFFVAFICFGIYFERVVKQRRKLRERQVYGDRLGPPPVTVKDIPRHADGSPMRQGSPGGYHSNPLNDFPAPMSAAGAGGVSYPMSGGGGARPYSVGLGYENRPVVSIPPAHRLHPVGCGDPPPGDAFVDFVRTAPDSPVYMTQSPPFKMSKTYTTTTADGHVTGHHVGR